MQSALLDAALKLPPDERRELADRLYETLEPDETDFELSPEQMAELERRVDQLDRTGPIGRPWREVLDEIRTRHLS